MDEENKSNLIENYTAASVFPKKLFHRKVIRKDGTIIPYHVQVNLTNKCNLNCKFCSCKDRDKSLILSLNDMKKVLDIISERGCQAVTMSLDKDEIIPVESENYVKLISIGNFVENYDNKKDYISWTLNDTLSKDKIDNVFKHHHRGILFKITLEGGRNILTTGNHSIYFYENEKIINNNVEDCRIGDYVVLSNINFPEYEYINIDTSKFKYIKKRGLINPQSFKTNPNFCRLLGYFIAEGCIDKDFYNIIWTFGDYNGKDKKYIEDIMCILNSMGFNKNIRTYKYKNKTQIRLYSKWFCQMIDSLNYGGKANLKRVPDIILNLSKINGINFLKGLFAGDGNFRNTRHRGCHRNSLVLKTSSESMTKTISFLLDKLNIKFTINEGKSKDRYIRNRLLKESKYYAINISGKEELENVIEIINFMGGSLKYRNNKFSRFKSNINKLKINKDAYALKIKKIEKINFEGDVYDISIKDSHRFITSFGILAHNTGGGEPLTHPEINEIIDYAESKKVNIGLVTNGLLLKRLKFHKNITWCRISNSDDRSPNYEIIEHAVNLNPHIGWAFSHVLTSNPNYESIKGLINFANKHNFTHIRIVSDLLDLKNIKEMDEVKKSLGNIDDHLVIYQGRKDSTKGQKKCFISLLKPVIAPEGIFACCGIQYAINGQKRDMVKRMKMGDINDLKNILDKQKYFDGSICDVCYYKGYNDVLSILKEKVDHKDFI